MKLQLLLILTCIGINTLLVGCENNKRRRVKEIDSSTLPQDFAENKKNTAAFNDSLAQYTIQEILKKDTLTSTTFQLMESINVDSLLGTEGPFTVLVPINSAWNKLPGGTMQNLKQLESRENLANLLGSHIIRGHIQTNNLSTGSKLKTLQNEELNVILKDSLILIEDGHGETTIIVKSNLPAKNGTIHLIDGVIMPYR